jgi:hypothetical protein
MNRDLEAIKYLLAWLIQDPNLTIATPSGEPSSREIGVGQTGLTDLDLTHLDSLSADEISDLLSHSRNIVSLSSNHHLFEEGSSFELGDIPAVQERFYTLLKRRLRTEIERNPPLFPWESEICDHDAEYSDCAHPELVPSNFWASQFKNLSIPVPMPEALLSQLLSRCQDIVQSSLKRGAKLVQAVEPLFPGQSHTLNQLAGLVMASEQVRSATLPSTLVPSPAANSEFPNRYDVATPVQQMALSLVAAREILDSLSLTVSADQSSSQRQWLTQAGALSIEAAYASSPKPCLRIQGHIPCQGTLRLKGSQAESMTQRLVPGHVSVELFDVDVNQTYALEIQLRTPDPSSLTFAVSVLPTSDR